jgi:transketolase
MLRSKPILIWNTHMESTSRPEIVFPELLKKAKRRLLQMHYESQVGHLGGNLSCIDALLYLHHFVLKKEDLFVLSKGHSAGALYAVLWSIGKLSDEDLRRFHRDGSKIAGHPVAGWLPEIPVATGSLGHGFPVAAGMALGKRLQEQTGQIYCLMSDGEWQEGSNWEALIFAHHNQICNLTVLIDVNGLQGFGTTTEVASMAGIPERISAFGVPISTINGHDPKALAEIIEQTAPCIGPRFILLNTIKGNGISFMENKLEWHYLPMTDVQYSLALQELEAK